MTLEDPVFHRRTLGYPPSDRVVERRERVMNRGLIGTIIGVLVVIILVIVILQLT